MSNYNRHRNYFEHNAIAERVDHRTPEVLDLPPVTDPLVQEISHCMERHKETKNGGVRGIEVVEHRSPDNDGEPDAASKFAMESLRVVG